MQLLKDEYVTECLRSGSYVEEAVDEIRRANPDYVPVVRLTTAQKAKQRLSALKRKMKRPGDVPSESARPDGSTPEPAFDALSPTSLVPGNGLAPVPAATMPPSDNVVVNMPPGARETAQGTSGNSSAQAQPASGSGLVSPSGLVPAAVVGSWTDASSGPPCVDEVEIVDTHRVGNHIVRVAVSVGLCGHTLLCAHGFVVVGCRCMRWRRGSPTVHCRAFVSSAGSVSSTLYGPRYEAIALPWVH